MHAKFLLIKDPRNLLYNQLLTNNPLNFPLFNNQLLETINKTQQPPTTANNNLIPQFDWLARNPFESLYAAAALAAATNNTTNASNNNNSNNNPLLAAAAAAAAAAIAASSQQPNDILSRFNLAELAQRQQSLNK